VSRHRSISALLVDVPAGHAALLQRALDDAGWTVRAVPVHGPEALSAALQRRGWDAVLYGGEEEGAVPARKALALVRLADPHLPFVAVSPHVRPGELAAVVRGLPGAIPTVVDPAGLPATLTRELEQAHMRRRVGGAHRLLSAQQAIADHLAAGLEPEALLGRVLATLGGSLGWSFGAVWRPDGDVLRCASAWHAPTARGPVAEFAFAARDQTFVPGQGLPGRVWAFRRPAWSSDVPPSAVRAGLVTGAAFPIALGDECLGVVELLASDARESNGEIAAMFATVGNQLAQYLARRRNSFHGADALVVGLDAGGRVELANATARATLGDDLLGRDWFTAAVSERDRPQARVEFARLLCGDGGALRALARIGDIEWRWSLSRDATGEPVGALGWGEKAQEPALAMLTAWRAALA
jgi:GAF domain